MERTVNRAIQSLVLVFVLGSHAEFLKAPSQGDLVGQGSSESHYQRPSP